MFEEKLSLFKDSVYKNTEILFLMCNKEKGSVLYFSFKNKSDFVKTICFTPENIYKKKELVNLIPNQDSFLFTVALDIEEISFIFYPVLKIYPSLINNLLFFSSKKVKLRMCSSCLKIKNNDKLKKCKKCNVIYYCDKDCQKKDWQKHKEQCFSLKN